MVPNTFFRLLLDDQALRNPWTLKFSNGSDQASAVVNLPAGATQVPFVESIALSGSSANPTFSWAAPAGTAVNGYRINIYDKSLIGPGNSGGIVRRNLLPSQNSIAVTPALFTTPGYEFALNKNYSIEISIIQTKDGASSNLGNVNLKAISRAYADFTPNSGGGPPVNLPVVLVNGAYQYDMNIVAGQVYYIEPLVAIGYDHEIGAGNPNFATLDLDSMGPSSN